MKDEITVSRADLARAFRAAVCHNGTLPDDQEGSVILTDDEVRTAAAWLWEELGGEPDRL